MSTTASSAEQRCAICGGPIPPWVVSLRQRTGSDDRRCPTCARLEHDADEDARTRASGDAVLEARIRRSRLPRTMLSWQLEDLTIPEALADAVRGWVSGSIPALYLWGPTGTGKSTVAAVALRLMLEREVAYWISAPALAVAYGADFNDPARDRALEVLTSPGALVLDDLGQERPTEQFRELLFTALNDRLADGVPVVITSNKLPSELGALYGDWLPSRLAGGMHAYRMPGPDRRITPTTPY